jgi:formate hydrogenlyase subunit 6/NADH:ubiquinone oxidoreductase subunit I
MPIDILERFLRPLRRRALTGCYPAEPAVLAPAMRGLPELDPVRCDSSAACVAICPTGAIALGPATWAIDAGRCVFCGACAAACPRDAIGLGQRFELAGRTREALVLITPIGGPR